MKKTFIEVSDFMIPYWQHNSAPGVDSFGNVSYPGEKLNL